MIQIHILESMWVTNQPETLGFCWKIYLQCSKPSFFYNHAICMKADFGKFATQRITIFKLEDAYDAVLESQNQKPQAIDHNPQDRNRF